MIKIQKEDFGVDSEIKKIKSLSQEMIHRQTLTVADLI